MMVTMAMVVLRDDHLMIDGGIGDDYGLIPISLT